MGAKPQTGCFTNVLTLLFSVLGFFLALFLVVIPMRKGMASRGWKEVPCKITSSGVIEKEGEDSTSYEPDIHFSYVYEGAEYNGKGYKIMEVSSSKRAKMEQLVSLYKPGDLSTCRVNPENPGEAILLPGITTAAYQIVIPLLFYLVGFYIFFSSIAPSEKKKVIANRKEPYLELFPSGLPLKRALSMTIFASGWCYIAYTPLTELIYRVETNTLKSAMILTFVPVILIGIHFAYKALYYLLALPKPQMGPMQLTFPVTPVKKLTFQWRLSGGPEPLRSLKTGIQGYEEAVYREGTNTKTDSEVFYENTVLETKKQSLMASGKVNFELPPDAMPAFQSKNNRIGWRLKIEGDLGRWPPISEQYSLEVIPQQGGTGPTVEPHSGLQDRKVEEAALTGGCGHEPDSSPDEAGDLSGDGVPGTISIAFRDDRDGFLPGGELQGCVSGLAESEISSASLHLIWETSGKGTVDRDCVKEIPLFAGPAPGEWDFTLVLPVFPFTFSGKLISLQWFLELSSARLSKPLRREVVISPTGWEVLLYYDESKRKSL